MGPILNEARYYHGCTQYMENGKSYIMVSGGIAYGYTKTVEILDATDLKKGWNFGPELPLAIWMHQMVAFEDRVYVIGGVDTYGLRDTILRYQNGVWNEMATKLAVARAQFVAIPLTEDQGEEFCHCERKSLGDLSLREGRFYEFDYAICNKWKYKSIIDDRSYVKVYSGK